VKSTIAASAVVVALAFPGGAWAAHKSAAHGDVAETTTIQVTTVQTTSVSPSASDHAGAGNTPQTTIVQTTTVAAPSTGGNPKSNPTKCTPGTTDPNLCETVPPHPRAKHRKVKPPPPATQKPAPAPTSAPASPAVPAVPAGPILPPLPRTLSGLAAKAVDALIDVFPVPPFLLPIYQAAGIDYGVPWPVLAAINEIETDFGRNLSVSSAGAVGWMQFLPSTWSKFGLDTDARGTANPYDPIDAIFAAARYLNAAGAGGNLRRAIFAYNHAGWYVDSVVLRAKLLQYLPQGLVDALTGLMQARFPLAGHLGRYAGATPARVRVSGQPGVRLNAPAGAPVIAVADGHVVAEGHHAHGGWYLTLEDSYGNRYTYSGLGTIEDVYPMVDPRGERAAQVAGEAGLRRTATQRGVASTATGLVAAETDPTRVSGSGARATKGSGSGATKGSGSGVGPTAGSGGGDGARGVAASQLAAEQPPVMVKERLFADPLRPASYAAGGSIQLQSSLSSYALATWLQVGGRGPADYFSEPLHLTPRHFRLAPLRRGATVVAGTVLGRLARPGHGSAPGIGFQVRPAGATRPVDPTSIIAGWELLGRLTAGRSALVGADETGAYGSRNLSLGQLLLASKAALERAVLMDWRVSIYPCGRHDIQAGLVDRRVLSVIEYLSYSGLAPDVTGLICGQPGGAGGQPGTDLQISRLDGIPVAGHQRNGGVVDLAIRALLQLQGSLRPEQIISLRSYPWQSSTLALPDHADRLEIDFSAPTVGGTSAAAESLDSAQWKRLISRLDQLAGQPGEPTPFNESLASGR
jgi:Transglycosylase SLT domain